MNTLDICNNVILEEYTNTAMALSIKDRTVQLSKGQTTKLMQALKALGVDPELRKMVSMPIMNDVANNIYECVTLLICEENISKIKSKADEIERCLAKIGFYHEIEYAKLSDEAKKAKKRAEEEQKVVLNNSIRGELKKLPKFKIIKEYKTQPELRQLYCKIIRHFTGVPAKFIGGLEIGRGEVFGVMDFYIMPDSPTDNTYYIPNQKSKANDFLQMIYLLENKTACESANLDNGELLYRIKSFSPEALSIVMYKLNAISCVDFFIDIKRFQPKHLKEADKLSKELGLY